MPTNRLGARTINKVPPMRKCMGGTDFCSKQLLRRVDHTHHLLAGFVFAGLLCKVTILPQIPELSVKRLPQKIKADEAEARLQEILEAF